MIGCVDCGRPLTQRPEKAIGNGEFQMVYVAPDTYDWICPKTGDEHRPEDLTPYEVTIQTKVIVLARDEDDAYELSNDLAQEKVAEGEYDSVIDLVGHDHAD